MRESLVNGFHSILDLSRSLEKLQTDKGTESLNHNMEKIHGWTANKKSVQIAGTELYVITYAGLVFGNNIVHSI